MEKMRNTEEQIAFSLRQAEEQSPGIGGSEIRRPERLEDESARLTRIVADLTLDKAMLQVAADRIFRH